MNYLLLLIPLLSAFIGWITIKLAIRLLFRPYTPKKILGFSLHGIFPAQKMQIARQAGKHVAKEFSLAGIEQKINDPKNFAAVKPLIEIHIDDFLRNKLKEQMPMISMFIGDKTINSLKTIFIQEIETLFPQVMQQFANNLKNELNPEQMIVSKISSISPEQFETAVYLNISKEIRIASFFGAAIGLLMGIIQLVIILLSR
ncbi:MAG TPA: hypothetical protein VJ111_04065 [Chitinophagaceae bacterium]|nr:hypothetical protein [Chitinophagaceae bacterium]